MPGVNDLALKWPELAREWHPDNELGPEQYLPYSNIKVKWLCQWGHEWETTINKRTASLTKCPACAGRKTSQVELDVLCSLSRYSEVRSGSLVAGLKVDILVPKFKLVVEYDGLRWHKDRTAQDAKNSLLVIKQGYSLHRLRENGLQFLAVDHHAYSESAFTWSKDLEEIDAQVDSCFASRLASLRSS